MSVHYFLSLWLHFITYGWTAVIGGNTWELQVPWFLSWTDLLGLNKEAGSMETWWKAGVCKVIEYIKKILLLGLYFNGFLNVITWMLIFSRVCCFQGSFIRTQKPTAGGLAGPFQSIKLQGVFVLMAWLAIFLAAQPERNNQDTPCYFTITVPAKF